MKRHHPQDMNSAHYAAHLRWLSKQAQVTDPKRARQMRDEAYAIEARIAQGYYRWASNHRKD